MNYQIRPVLFNDRYQKGNRGIFYEIIFEDKEKNHGYVELLFYPLNKLKILHKICNSERIELSDTIAHINRFFPNGSSKSKEEEIGRKGVGTDILLRCIEDSKQNGAKILFIGFASDKLCDYLRKRNFIEIGQFAFYINLSIYKLEDLKKLD